MRFILHQDLSHVSSLDTYKMGKILLYYLGEKIHLSGIGESVYYLNEDVMEGDVVGKLQFLIDIDQGKDTSQYEEAMRVIKGYPKIKNKDSKLIIHYNLLKKGIEQHYAHALNERYQYLNRILDLDTYKELIDYQNVNFYHLTESHTIYKNPTITPLVTILSLQLPEEEGEFPILFLNNENREENPILEFITHPPNSKKAEQLTDTYLTDVFYFPGVIGVPSSMMKAMRYNFSKKAKPILEQLHLWAKTCYENPNSNKGLIYFRNQVEPMIEEYKRISFDFEIGNEISESAPKGSYGVLQFGEMPIATIWELMYLSNHCKEEEYNELLKLKETQAPKYDGRWPVVLINDDGNTKKRREEKQIKIPTTRKTLDID